MSVQLTPETEAAVLAAVRVSFPDAVIEHVREVNETGGVSPGPIGDDYDDALTDKIQDALDAVADGAA